MSSNWNEVLSTQLNSETFRNIEKVHPLALEDCVHRDQRPKLEDYESHQFLVWFMLAEGKIFEIQFLIFENEIVFVPHEPPPKGTLWSEYFNIDNKNHSDVWHLLYHVLDKSTDHTWDEVTRVCDQIDQFEIDLFEKECDPRTLMSLKKKLNQIDFYIAHLPSVSLQIQNFKQPKNDLRWKFRDLHDHCERITRTVSLYRGQIATSIELYWGQQTHKANRHIKKLSVLASVAVPLTFWASFWGMNFEFLPFKSESFFYFAILIMILSVSLTVFILIKKGYWED